MRKANTDLADVNNASGVPELFSALQTRGKGEQRRKDITTMATWASSMCGTPLPATSSAG
jgi:hypothetical protein